MAIELIWGCLRDDENILDNLEDSASYGFVGMHTWKDVFDCFILLPSQQTVSASLNVLYGAGIQ